MKYSRCIRFYENWLLFLVILRFFICFSSKPVVAGVYLLHDRPYRVIKLLRKTILIVSGKMAFCLAKKTKWCLHTKLSVYLGSLKKFLPAEFPTLRETLQQGLDLQQHPILTHGKRLRNISMHEIFFQVALDIAARWQILIASSGNQ